MKPKDSLWLLLFVLLTACYSDPRREMLALLDEADSLNRAYAQLPSDTLLLEAADFFDRHGTANEQVRAHYLLGCAYRDQGQAPEALQAWQDAIDRADTLSSDSVHNALLCRVYSQMADIFYLQNLTSYQLSSINHSIDKALACKDTIALIRSCLHKMGVYIKRNQPDSVVAVYNEAYFISLKHKSLWLAAGGAMAVVPSLLQLKQYNKAAEYISLYEGKSGLVDSLGNVEKGREVFYYLKGMYYLAVCKHDSAEILFRKTLTEGYDFNCQNAAAHGLAELYVQTNQIDSALKYALYSYDMNDSVYSKMAISEVGRIKTLYDYSVYQRDAKEANEKAYREKSKVLFLCTILLCMLIVFAILINNWRKKRKAVIEEYIKVVQSLNIAQAEVLHIRSQEDELNQYIKVREKEFEKLLSEFSSLKEKVEKDNKALEPIEQSPIYVLLQSKAIKGIGLTEEEWFELNKLVINRMSSFYLYVSDRRHDLKLQEYRICVLLHLGVKPIDISHMFEYDPAYVTRLGKSALRKLFGCDGKLKDLTERMNHIG